MGLFLDGDIRRGGNNNITLVVGSFNYVKHGEDLGLAGELELRFKAKKEDDSPVSCSPQHLYP